MGQSKSKNKRTSYDVAPVVSDKDFKYENTKAKQQSNDDVKSDEIVKNVIVEEAALPTVSEESGIGAVMATSTVAHTEPIPTWVTEEYFVDILKMREPQFERIEKFDVQPALGAGENYATLVLRVNIDILLQDTTTKQVSYILKLPHDNEQMRQMLNLMNFFIPENLMYTDIIPEFEKIYKDAGVDICFAAKHYQFVKEIPGTFYVLLEDLKPSGFKNANRLNGLNMEHTEFLLKNLAQWHAVSAHRVETIGLYPKNLLEFEFSEEALAIWSQMMSSFGVILMNNYHRFKGCEKYRESVQIACDNIMKAYGTMSSFDPNEFNVLNHGDCWSNNILFKYDADGKVIDLRFVDYQISRYGPCAQDLLYFLFSSTSIDNKLQKFDYLVRFYYDHLIENLKLLKYPKKLPILRELYMQLFKYGSWAFAASIMTLPIVLLDPTDKANFENFLSDSSVGMDFKNMLYANPRYIDQIVQLLPWFYNRGLLEPYEISNLSTIAVDKDGASASIITLKTNVDEAIVTKNLEIPEWLTENYFIDLLRENVKNFKSINKFLISSPVSSGDNYASILLQIDIEIQLEDATTATHSFMLKIPPQSEQAEAMLSSMNTFNKELTFYNDYKEQFEALYKSAGQHDVTFAPKFFKFVKDPGCAAVLLENLRPLGFQNVDRLKGLDQVHVENVLAKLAQFHAASAVLATKNEYPETFMEGMFSEKHREIMEKMANTFMEIYLDCVKNYEGSEEYLHKIKAVQKSYFDVMSKAAAVDPNGFNVLNHGDAWTNNILFQYDDTGKIINTYLIDYQMVKYGSPVYDLYYFLISSPCFEVKLEKFDHFIRFYHENLTKNLKLLEFEKTIPTLKELHVELLERGAFGLAISSGIMAAVLLDKTDDANFDTMISNDETGISFKNRMYSNPIYRKHAEAILPWLNRRGLLDLFIDTNNSD